jgi:hypothetical protein
MITDFVAPWRFLNGATFSPLALEQVAQKVRGVGTLLFRFLCPRFPRATCVFFPMISPSPLVSMFTQIRH